MKTVVSSIFIVLVAFGSFAQSSKSLKKDQQKLQRKINETKNLLKDNQQKFNSELDQLNVINAQIRSQEQLLRNYSRQVDALNMESKANTVKIKELELKIARLKNDYGKLIRFSYRFRNQDNSLLYVLSAQSVSESYKRLKFVQQIKNNLKKKLEELRLAKLELQAAKTAIESAKVNIKQAEKNKRNERSRILTAKGERQKILDKIKTKSKSLENELRKQEKEKERIRKAIRKAIQEEIRKQAEIKKNKEKGSSSSKIGVTADALLKGKSFAANKGRLPWPVLTGTITGKFGKNPHPVYKNIMVDNTGVDITTKSGQVRAVFGGKVTSILNIPGAGRVVIVQHGNYRTVYGNLSEVNVSKGDTVEPRETIGTLLVKPGEKLGVSHFEIWQATADGDVKQLNPALWLAK